jgi:hypothetical protein
MLETMFESGAEVRPMTTKRHKKDEVVLKGLGLWPIPILDPDERLKVEVEIIEPVNAEKSAGKKPRFRKRLADVFYWRRGQDVLNITEKNGHVHYQAPFFIIKDKRDKEQRFWEPTFLE